MGAFLGNPFVVFPASGTWLPSTPSNLFAWFDSSDVNDGTEPSDNDNVSTWQDLSANGYDIAQGTGTDQPTYETGQINGLPAVTYDSTDSMSATTASINGLSGFTMAVVCSTSDSYFADSYGCQIFWGETGSWGKTFINVGKNGVGWRFGTGESSNNPNWSRGSDDTGYNTWILVKDGTSEYLYENGTLRATHTAANTTLANNSTTMRVGIAGGYSLAEAIVYNTTLSSSDITSLSSYFATKYGL